MIQLNRLGRDDDFTFCPDLCDGQGGYTSPDARLVSSGHNGVRLQLDTRPLNGKVKESDVYNNRPGYGPFYSNYSHIESGQNTYYIDPQLAQPFIPQLFSGGENAVTLVDMYIDPMGTVKPHYCRAKINNSDGFCLSWLRDSTNHREDLLARQLWKRNQSKYENLKAITFTC